MRCACGCADKILSKMGEGSYFQKPAVSGSKTIAQVSPILGLVYYLSVRSVKIDFNLVFWLSRHFWKSARVLGQEEQGVCCHQDCSKCAEIQGRCNDRGALAFNADPLKEVEGPPHAYEQVCILWSSGIWGMELFRHCCHCLMSS